MDPIDIEKLRPFVEAAVRGRGEEYARSGAVRITSNRRDEVRGVASGSRDYAVALRYSKGQLLCRCECPYFFDQAICKHIWALVLVCVTQQVRFSGDATALTEDPRAPINLSDDFDDVELEEDDDYDEDDDREFSASDVREQLRMRDWPINRSGAASGGVSQSVPPRKSRWREQIARLRQWTPRTERTSGSLPPITWVIDPRTSTDSIALEATRRDRKKNGQLGRPKPAPVSSHEIPDAVDPVDRETLALIFPSYHYRESRFNVRRELARYLVPKLVSTGRLLMRTPDGDCADVAFDDGEPWSLHVAAEDRGDVYALVPTLRRGNEVLPLDATLGISSDYVFFRGRIGKISDEYAGTWARALRSEEVTIPREEIDDFQRALNATDISLRVAFPADVNWAERGVRPQAFLHFASRRPGEQLSGIAEFDYEGHRTNALLRTRAVYASESRISYLRDFAEEQRLLNVMWANGVHRSTEVVYIWPEDLAAGLLALTDGGWEVSGDEGVYRSGGQLQLSVRGAIDWFDLDAEVTFGSERVTFPQLLAALREGRTWVELGGGKAGLIRPEWKDELEPLLAMAAEQKPDGLRFRKNQLLLLDALLASREQTSFDEVFKTARKKLLNAKVRPQKPPRTFRGELRPYQREGLGWFAFLRETGFGGCLADDMGLGKTVQVLALLEQRRKVAGRPSLVVAPRSIVFNWKSEAERFTPALRILDHSTPDRIKASEHFGDYDLIITTYALLRKEAELLGSVHFDHVILDESQAIKNASSQAAKAALLLRADYRLALSGTPIENHLGELGSLFEFLNPGMLRGRSSRMSTLLRNAGAQSAGAAEQRELLARAVRPFILRRTKSQVATELPERVEQTIYCELEPAQRKLYDELREYYRASLLGLIAKKGLLRSKIHVLEALLRMRQAAIHPALVDAKRTGDSSAKMEALFERVPVLVDEGHKVLVFSQFTSMLALVRSEMSRRGIAYAYLDGQSRDRADQVRRFQEDPSVPVFLISLKAGGLGLNLTAAEYVYLLDPWWNPAVEAQAIDRAHRIGQTRNVFASRIVARDTIEEKILLLQQSKRALADAILSEENSVLRNLTTEDLELLLS